MKRVNLFQNRSPIRALFLEEGSSHALKNLLDISEKFRFSHVFVSTEEEVELALKKSLKPILSVKTLDPTKAPNVFFNSTLYQENQTEKLKKEDKLFLDLCLEEINDLEMAFKGKMVFYQIPANPLFSDKFYLELERHFPPNMLAIFPAVTKGIEHPLWKVRKKNAIPIISLLPIDAPLFLPEDIDKFLLRKDGVETLGGVLTVKTLPSEGSYIEAHLKSVIEALIDGTSPHVTFRKWMEKNRGEFTSSMSEWITKLSLMFPKYLNLERARIDLTSQEDVRFLVEGLVFEFRDIDKKIESSFQRGENDPHYLKFLTEVELFIKNFKALSIEVLRLHQISPPLYLT